VRVAALPLILAFGCAPIPLGCATILLGCAPIDVNSEVTIEPRPGPIEQIGDAQLVARDFIADYVQVGPRVLVEIRELSTCAYARHHPVLRIEHVRRTNRGFVIWDFALGTFTGAFAAVAFARPQTFATRLVDGNGRQVYDYTGAYVVGSVFSAISVGLLTAGIVDAMRSRDTTRYADAYEVELGPEQPCSDAQTVPLASRPITLRIDDGVIELDGITDETGRARFELPTWPAEPPTNGAAAAVISVTMPDGGVEPRVLVFSLRVPYAGMLDAQAGVADTRTPAAEPPMTLEQPAVEGPELPP
jgi:hypothetical protein